MQLGVHIYIILFRMTLILVAFNFFEQELKNLNFNFLRWAVPLRQQYKTHIIRFFICWWTKWHCDAAKDQRIFFIDEPVLIVPLANSHPRLTNLLWRRRSRAKLLICQHINRVPVLPILSLSHTPWQGKANADDVMYL